MSDEIRAESLAVKVRPDSFLDIVGQDHNVERMISMLETGDVAPAQIFSGPFGSGKTTSARLMAKSLQCEAFDFEQLMPCGKCKPCKIFGTENDSSFEEINCAVEGIDVIKRMIAESQYIPEGKYWIRILDECHKLHHQAIEGLLKPTEDGGHGKTIWMLCTTEVNSLKDTLRSRCEEFNMKPVEPEVIAGRLLDVAEMEGINLSEENALAIGDVSDGSVRQGIKLLASAMRAAIDGVITTESLEAISAKYESDDEETCVAFLMVVYGLAGSQKQRENAILSLCEIGDLVRIVETLTYINGRVMIDCCNYCQAKEHRIKNPYFYSNAKKKLMDQVYESIKGDDKFRQHILDVSLELSEKLVVLKQRMWSLAKGVDAGLQLGIIIPTLMCDRR